MKHVNLDAFDEAVKQFVLSLIPDTRGAVLEIDGSPVACVVPLTGAEIVGDRVVSDWDAAKDSRRCALIDREIAGTLSANEATELQALQAAMLRHRRQIAPLPLEEARQLHRELLEKAGGTGA